MGVEIVVLCIAGQSLLILQWHSLKYSSRTVEHFDQFVCTQNSGF